MHRISHLRLGLFTVFLAGCSVAPRTLELPTGRARLFDGLGQYRLASHETKPAARPYIDQAFVWMYAFNHDEAIRSFHAAAILAPDDPLPWWGIAVCNGPHINFPLVPPERNAAALAALKEARKRWAHASERDRALIEALEARYAESPPEDRRPLDEAYAAAMKRVYEKFPDDVDVGVLYAEALFDLRPWDLWTQAGEPREETIEALRVLDGVLARSPDHPGANHLYIHALEASPHPERALAAADRLRTSAPGVGHLVHMPSHIDVLTGRWSEAVLQNARAIEADRKYRALAPPLGFYQVYRAHNQHMLAFAAMMSGRFATALEAADGAVRDTPEDYIRANAPLIDPFMGARYDVLKRFGRWDDLLAEPAPPDCLPFTTAMWRYSRAVAYAAKRDVDSARAAQVEFRAAVARVPADTLLAINLAHDVLRIADHLLAGEIAYAAGDSDAAVAELEIAVRLEDQLRYMEPPEWIQPARHTLGVVLLESGRYAEAEQVYRADLKKWPKNGWSLFGLSQALRAQGKTADADAVDAEFRKAWADADTEIHASCLCGRKA
jgi:tetratricopeptide (TPR) repeat protein